MHSKMTLPSRSGFTTSILGYADLPDFMYYISNELHRVALLFCWQSKLLWNCTWIYKSSPCSNVRSYPSFAALRHSITMLPVRETDGQIRFDKIILNVASMDRSLSLLHFTTITVSNWSWCLRFGWHPSVAIFVFLCFFFFYDCDCNVSESEPGINLNQKLIRFTNLKLWLISSVNAFDL